VWQVDSKQPLLRRYSFSLCPNPFVESSTSDPMSDQCGREGGGGIRPEKSLAMSTLGQTKYRN